MSPQVAHTKKQWSHQANGHVKAWNRGEGRSSEIKFEGRVDFISFEVWNGEKRSLMKLQIFWLGIRLIWTVVTKGWFSPITSWLEDFGFIVDEKYCGRKTYSHDGNSSRCGFRVDWWKLWAVRDDFRDGLNGGHGMVDGEWSLWCGWR